MNKDLINATTIGIGTLATYLFGGWDKIIQILAIVMIADYVTGVLKAITKKDVASGVGWGWEGIVKKGSVFIVIILAHQMDLMANPESPIFRTMCIYFYIANEGISITENLAILGVPFPRFITDALKKIRNENNQLEVKNNDI